MLVILAFAALVKIFLAAGQHLFIIGYAGQDDQLFINLAHSILNGDWLGSYNNMTLIKGPFYPLFLAANHLTHIPLLITEQILYIVAVFAFLFSVYPLLRKIGNIQVSDKLVRLAIIVIGLFLIFNPMSTSVEPATRVTYNKKVLTCS